MPHRALLTVLVFGVTGVTGFAGIAMTACRQTTLEPPTHPPASTVRIATFNVEELSLAKLEQTASSGAGTNPQLLAAAAVVQRVRPQILVLNEIDFIAGEPTRTASLFIERYLSRGETPIDYPYLFSAPTNTGLLSGSDLDNDGAVATEADLGSRRYGGDCWGFGTYPGQYGMALLSQYPIASTDVRTFQKFLWRDLPGNHLPVDFYDEEEQQRLRLSSKSHWDVPVEIGATTLHLWMSHPTPPAFDGEEDRNGRRNFDEIEFWVAYLDGEEALYDDDERHGGFAPPSAGAPFIIAGDLNARPDPPDGTPYDGRSAISQLLDRSEIEDTGELCTSSGGVEHAATAADAPAHPERSTAEFLGGSRVDYLLPSRGIELANGGVFWPAARDDPEGHDLAEKASDHRLVWLDLVLPAQ